MQNEKSPMTLLIVFGHQQDRRMRFVVILICAAVCFNAVQGSEQEDQGEQGSLVRALETPGEPLDAEDDPVAEAKEELQLMDLNGDGKASLAEIQAFFKKVLACSLTTRSSLKLIRATCLSADSPPLPSRLIFP